MQDLLPLSFLPFLSSALADSNTFSRNGIPHFNATFSSLESNGRKESQQVFFLACQSNNPLPLWNARSQKEKKRKNQSNLVQNSNILLYSTTFLNVKVRIISL